MNDDEKKLCEMLRAVDGAYANSYGMRLYAAKTIESQAERIEALSAKCALLEAALAQADGRLAEAVELLKPVTVPLLEWCERREDFLKKVE